MLGKLTKFYNITMINITDSLNINFGPYNVNDKCFCSFKIDNHYIIDYIIERKSVQLFIDLEFVKKFYVNRS